MVVKVHACEYLKLQRDYDIHRDAVVSLGHMNGDSPSQYSLRLLRVLREHSLQLWRMTTIVSVPDPDSDDDKTDSESDDETDSESYDDPIVDARFNKWIEYKQDVESIIGSLLHDLICMINGAWQDCVDQSVNYKQELMNWVSKLNLKRGVTPGSPTTYHNLRNVCEPALKKFPSLTFER